MPLPPPSPGPQVPSFWEQWAEVFILLALMGGTSVWMWGQPASTHFYLLALIGIGCLFDSLSLFYYVLTLIKRRLHSGIPGVGFVFFFWAWLAYPHSVLFASGEGFWRIALAKLPDLAVLGLVQFLVHVPLPRFTREFRPEVRDGNSSAPAEPSVHP
jgi:hypothetical protein